MKKNIVGHVTKPHESAGSALRSFHPLARLVCLLLALLIWLLIVNLNPGERKDQTNDPVHTEQGV